MVEADCPHNQDNTKRIGLALCYSLGMSVKLLILLLTWGHFPSELTEQAQQFAQQG